MPTNNKHYLMVNRNTRDKITINVTSFSILFPPPPDIAPTLFALFILIDYQFISLPRSIHSAHLNGINE